MTRSLQNPGKLAMQEEKSEESSLCESMLMLLAMYFATWLLKGGCNAMQTRTWESKIDGGIKLKWHRNCFFYVTNYYGKNVGEGIKWEI